MTNKKSSRYQISPHQKRDEDAYWQWRAAIASGNPAEISLREKILFRKLRHYARAILRKRLNFNEIDAIYDLADRAVALAFTKGADYTGRGRFTSWYWRITSNLCSEWLRDNRRRPKRAIRPSQLISIEALMRTPQEPASTPEGLEARILVGQLRSKLPPEGRPLFDAKLEGQSDREICSSLGLFYTSHSHNGAASQWKKLRKQLLSLLGVTTAYSRPVTSLPSPIN